MSEKNEWKSISSAPRDELILVGPTKRMGICVAMNHSRDGWVTETCNEWHSIYTPKHWMPLPAEPCLTCNGHGMAGGLTPHSGYDAQPCPDCTPAPSAPGDSQDERQAFEAWHKSEFGSYEPDEANHYNRWLGWQAARASADAPAAPAAGDALGTVSLVTRQGWDQQLFTYTSQPCDNVIAWRIGEACTKASQASAGDYIDRGLGLLKELQAKGYGVAALAAQVPQQEDDDA